MKLFSLKTYQQINVGHSLLNGDAVDMHCKGNRVVIPIRCEQANLPIVYNYFVSSKEKKEVGQQIRSAIAYYNFSNLEFFAYLQTSIEMVNGKRGFDNTIKNKYEHYTQLCDPSLSLSPVTVTR